MGAKPPAGGGKRVYKGGAPSAWRFLGFVTKIIHFRYVSAEIFA